MLSGRCCSLCCTSLMYLRTSFSRSSNLTASMSIPLLVLHHSTRCVEQMQHNSIMCGHAQLLSNPLKSYCSMQLLDAVMTTSCKP